MLVSKIFFVDAHYISGLSKLKHGEVDEIMHEIVRQLLRQALFFPWPKICRRLDDMLKAGVHMG